MLAASTFLIIILIIIIIIISFQINLPKQQMRSQ